MYFASQSSTSEGVAGSRTGREQRRWWSFAIAFSIILVASGCSSNDVASEAATDTTTVVATTSTTAAPDTTTTVVVTTSTTAAPNTTTTVVAIEVPLPADVTETYSIPDFGYSIDYPASWFAETSEPQTGIVQIETDLFSDSNEGLGVSLDHRTVSFLQSIGLVSDDPTAQDLLEFNTTFDWTDVRELAEVEVFGGPAIRVRVTLPDGVESLQYQGIRSGTGEAFLFGFGAPNSEVFDEFLPTWAAMVESITATE